MILHVDMDAFYASVEERDQPQLVGKPVIVGGTPEGRGVVAAANYVVREFGVHSALPTATALKRCPHAVVLRPRMEHYAAISAEIHKVFQRYTPLVEPLSLDEAFLDVTGSERLFGSAVEIARTIKTEIQQAVDLVASVGVAPNKFLAKIASDLDKPDGFVIVDSDRVEEFLDPLPVGRLWGVGRVTGQVFEQLHIRTIGDLRRMPLDSLRQRFGNAGEHLYQLARGIDDRLVVPDREAKSISHETTFPTDIADFEVLRAWLLELTEQVGRRLRRHGFRGRTVSIKVRAADFCTITRSQSLTEPTDSTQTIWETAADLLDKRVPKNHFPLRLLGVGLSGFDHSEHSQKTLFADGPDLDATADDIRDRFGSSSLRRASSLQHDAEHRPQPE